MEDVSEFPRIVEKTDIDPTPPEIGGTKIVLQRHGKYERSIDNPNVGSLTEEGAQATYALGKEFFHILFDSIPVQERNGVDFLVVASDTQYEGRGRRSMETADKVMKALKEELSTQGLNESQLLNSSGNYRGERGPRPMHRLKEPQMLDNSSEFLKFLKEKYGDKTLQFWIAFEEDTHKDIREQMNTEGPNEITDRIKFAVEVLSQYSKLYHRAHPGKRLVIWATTHYDTISPFVKREIFGAGKVTPLGVDYGAGISINLHQSDNASTTIAGKEYKIPRRQP